MTNLEIIKGIYSGNADQIAQNLQSALASKFEWIEAAGFPCTNLANGTERNHEPGERVSVDARKTALQTGQIKQQPGDGV